MRAWVTPIRTAAVVLVAALALALAPEGRARAESAEDDESALLVAEARAAIGKGDYRRAASRLDRALAQNPRRIDAYVLRASVYAVDQQYAKGIELMQRAQSLAPDNPDVLSTLGSQLMLGHRESEGVPLLEKVGARWPDRYQAHQLLGLYYASHSEWARAERALSAFLKTRPRELEGEDPGVLIELGNATLRQGKPREAEALFAQALKGATGANAARARIGAAWAAASRDCRRAMKLLTALAPLAERYPDVELVRGRCVLALGRGAEALEISDRFLALRPKSADGHALRGEALAGAGQLAAARLAFEEALELSPGKRVYILKLARVERRAGDAKAAVARLEGAPELEAGERDWVLEMGEALLAAGRAPEAAALLTPLATRLPDDSSVALALGEARLTAGDAAGAIEPLERGWANGRGVDPGRARKLLGGALDKVAGAAYQAGDLGRAEALWTRAEPLSDGFRVARNLGAVRLAVGKGDPLSPLEKAAAAPGVDVTTLLLYGRALAGIKHWDDARRPLEKALERSKGDPTRVAEAALELSAMELESGQPLRATAALERALEGKLPAPLRARVEMAMITASRAAATDAMQSGAFDRASKLLERAEQLTFEVPQDTLTAVRCELALAATGAGRRDAALPRLRQLARTSATCPFPAPADKLAVPILTAFNEGAELSRAQKAFASLDNLRKSAKGVAEPLLDGAVRWIALQAAADAYQRGQLSQVKKFLARARKIKGASRSQELAHDLAVLDLEEGRLDAAIAALEKLVNDVPESLINLGLAYEKKGQSRRALEVWDIALSSGRVRFPQLKGWVAAKQRIFGTGGSAGDAGGGT